MSLFSSIFSRRQQAARTMVDVFGEGLSDTAEQDARNRRDHDAQFQRECQLIGRGLARVDELADDPDLLALVSPEQKIAPQKTAGRRIQWLAVAACLAFGVVLLGQGADWRSLLSFGVAKQSYQTTKGEQKEVLLADGSTITLNTNSELQVEMSGHVRQVHLVRGEAFFDIAADLEKPFQVDVGSHLINVLGTSFNITRGMDEFTLAVVDGLVAVQQEGEERNGIVPSPKTPGGGDVTVSATGKRLVMAGTVVRYDLKQNEATLSYPAAMQAYHRWRTGMLAFDGKPLSAVVQELNRYSVRPIVIADESIETLDIVAALRVDDISAGLAGLQHGNPIEVTEREDRIILSKQK